MWAKHLPSLMLLALQWCHNECHGISNHPHHDCLLRLWFRHRSKKTSELGVTGLCEGDSPATSEFPAQRASNVENDFIWGRHHGLLVMWQSKGQGNQQACFLPIAVLSDLSRPDKNAWHATNYAHGSCSVMFFVQYQLILLKSFKVTSLTMKQC